VMQLNAFETDRVTTRHHEMRSHGMFDDEREPRPPHTIPTPMEPSVRNDIILSFHNSFISFNVLQSLHGGPSVYCHVSIFTAPSVMIIFHVEGCSSNLRVHEPSH